MRHLVGLVLPEPKPCRIDASPGQKAVCQHEVVCEKLVRDNALVHSITHGQLDDAIAIAPDVALVLLTGGRVKPDDCVFDRGELGVAFITRIDKNLCLRLCEFAESDYALTRGNLVSICFSDLRNSKREFFSVEPEEPIKVDEHSLSGLRSEITHPLRARSDCGLEHQIEIEDLAKRSDSAALWAFDVVFVDQLLDLWCG